MMIIIIVVLLRTQSCSCQANSHKGGGNVQVLSDMRYGRVCACVIIS